VSDPKPEKKDPLKISVKVEGGFIQVVFDKPVSSIGFNKKEAVTFASSILSRVGELKE
jgi:hypothetical protein